MRVQRKESEIDSAIENGQLQAAAKALPRSPGNEREWLDACKGSKVKPGGNFEFAGMVTETLQLGNVSSRLGQKLNWSRIDLRVTNSDLANQYLRPERRKGWNSSRDCQTTPPRGDIHDFCFAKGISQACRSRCCRRRNVARSNHPTARRPAGHAHVGRQTWPVREMIGEGFPRSNQGACNGRLSGDRAVLPCRLCRSGFGQLSRYKASAAARNLGDAGIACVSLSSPSPS